MDTVVIASKRERTRSSFAHSGKPALRKNNVLLTAKNVKTAYQKPIQVHSDPLNLMPAATLDMAAPFSQAIRLASMNLNADTDALKRVPRSGLLPRIVDWDTGNEKPAPPAAPIIRREQGSPPPPGDDDDQGGDGPDGPTRNQEQNTSNFRPSRRNQERNVSNFSDIPPTPPYVS